VLVGTFEANPYAAAWPTFVMILAAGYLLYMYGRIVFGEVSDFLPGLGDHLTDMTPVEILTLVRSARSSSSSASSRAPARPRSEHRHRDARRSSRPHRSPSRRRSSSAPGSWPCSSCPHRLGPAPRRAAGSNRRRGRPLSWQDFVTISPLVAAS
jgi:hypothetical protein